MMTVIKRQTVRRVNLKTAVNNLVVSLRSVHLKATRRNKRNEICELKENKRQSKKKKKRMFPKALIRLKKVILTPCKLKRLLKRTKCLRKYIDGQKTQLDAKQ